MKTKFYSSRNSRFQSLTLRKSFKVIFSALALGLLFGGVLLLKTPSIARAAACSPPATTFGTDTLSINVQTAGTYNIWTRLEAPATTSNQIMLQVDSSNCFNVGGLSSMPLNTWTWVDYQNGSTSSLDQVTLTAGAHTLKFIGTETGVSVDRVILLSPTDPCAPPTGTGDTCTPAPTPPTITISAPTANQTVSGSTVAVSSVLGNVDSSATVTYKVDGNTVQTTTGTTSTTSWNSTTVADGSHTLSATVADNGLLTTAQETINVLNNVCTLAPTPPSGLTDTDTTPLPAGKVDLSWSAGAPAANCQLAGYNIYRTDSSGNTVKLNSTPIAGSSSNSITAVGTLNSKVIQPSAATNSIQQYVICPGVRQRWPNAPGGGARGQPYPAGRQGRARAARRGPR